MARYARTLPVGETRTQHLSMGILALCYPVPLVQQIIERCGCASRRQRDLPAVVVAFYVIALGLFPGTGYQNVLHWLLCGLQWLEAGTFRLSGKGAVSRARQRLGEEPLRLLFEQQAALLAGPRPRGCHWKGFQVVALDGSTLALQDTAANAAAFGRPSNQNGPGAYPMARFVALAEVGTHLVFAARLGRYDDGEVPLARKLMPHLQPGMLCLADRLFPGYELWQQALAQGAHLLWRAKTSLNLERRQDLPDGSWLACWRPARDKKAQSQIVRVIEYRLRGAEGEGEVFRLLTSLLDPAQAAAKELAALYPQRWEIELALKESKSVLRQGQLTLRSKVAALVRQEFWGLLLAHAAVRQMMAQAALESDKDPDEISFKASVEIIRASQASSGLPLSP